ncbi:hypothetical protein BD779DRAFT_1536645 [Infundibulicybe gibba]|nr:hypothetical protein BD779DRAFT_1536645 [Infundibulicybe gibba]
MPILSAGSNSSDYFNEEDLTFLQGLQDVVLPGDVPEPQPQAENSDQEEEYLEMPPLAQRPPKRTYEDSEPDVNNIQDDNDTYGASHFGGFGQYMKRKRAKLQIQNAEIDTTGHGATKSKLFSGVAIYVNGWTKPSIQQLRELIVTHGGIFHPYLDKKAVVTHIITCSLTPAKVHEFKHMKVVRPEWLVESANAGVLLPWRNFIFKPNDPPNVAHGVSKPLSSAQDQPKTYLKLNEQSRPQPLVPLANQLPKSVEGAARMGGVSNTSGSSSVPKYAAHESNPFAQRAMANSEWRKAHTSASNDFLEDYYKNSRLHHLSTWKAELKNLVQEAQERAEHGVGINSCSVGKIQSETIRTGGVSMRGAELRSPSKGKGKGKAKAVDQEERVIMHCDFDCFFVSAGLTSRPELKGKPVVVCHSQGAQGGMSSTSEIASASYEARSYGIKNGMSLQQARQLCPAIQTIPYEFERYKQLSLTFYTILMQHADDLQAVSVDEALIDVTNTVSQMRSHASQDSSIFDPATDYAETIRAQVRKATACEISIGISHNILLARLATRRAKPGGSYHLVPASVAEFLAPLDIADLHGFGRSAKQKAVEKLGSTTLGEMESKSKAALCNALGKAMGENLYNAIRGIDDKQLESDKPRKSVSCEINYGIRFSNNDQAEAFIHQMAAEVAKRLDEINMVGRSITLKIMKRDPTAPVEPPKFLGHGSCDLFSKQSPLITPTGRPTRDKHIIGEHAWRLLKSFHFDSKELRGIGLQIQKLESSTTSVQQQHGQAVIPFARVGDPSKATGSSTVLPEVAMRPPSETTGGENLPQDNGPPKISEMAIDLPSFSQVDMSVFHALPPDVRSELEAEYKRRSTSPFVEVAPQAVQPKPPLHGVANGPQIFPRNNRPPNFRGTSKQPGTRGRYNISPLRRLLFQKKAAPVVRITDAKLREFGIDPTVFAALPVKVQREQLTMARIIKEKGYLPEPPAERKVIKPRKYIPPPGLWRAPAPKARFRPPALLRQQGKEKREKLYFVETADIQNVIEKWVNSYRNWAPKAKDIQYFTKYLVESVDSSRSAHSGIETAIATLKWWLVLLRRYWGGSEMIEEDVSPSQLDPIGEAWWKAFREVKAAMDVIARKKFGGQLSLK